MFSVNGKDTAAVAVALMAPPTIVMSPRNYTSSHVILESFVVLATCWLCNYGAVPQMLRLHFL